MIRRRRTGTTGTLRRLMGAYIARDQDLGRDPRTVRDFVSEFRGLSGSAKRALVLERPAPCACRCRSSSATATAAALPSCSTPCNAKLGR